jgi:hypothetical protein
MSYASFGFNNMQVKEKNTVYHPSSSLLVIDSGDRNISTSNQVSETNAQPEQQPWNNFSIQTPDRLATGGINKICLHSIRFPWFIPNITLANNSLILLLDGTDINITIPTDGSTFFTGLEIATIMNGLLVPEVTAFRAGASIVITWIPKSQRFQWVATGLNNVDISFAAAVPYFPTEVADPEQFYFNPSLPLTMGFNYSQLSTTYIPPSDAAYTFFPSSPTELLYTRYVDIVSPRLLQYRRMMDGASKNNSRKPIIARIYCANENSQNSYDIAGNVIPQGTEPFLIHRKISDKSILWNPEATVDYLDFQVFDEFGAFVAVPSLASKNVYPSFQMTFVLSD